MLVREVPIPERTPIRVWLCWLAIAAVAAVVLVPSMFGSYMTRCTKSEEALQLNKVGKAAKAYFIEKQQFPLGRTQTLPPWPCCPAKCGVVPHQAWTADPIWAALEFSIDEATQVNYSYESLDGKTFRATAVRDARCNGVLRETVLEGWIDKIGNPVVSLVEPPPSRP